jgi:hypothetical protein
MLLSSSIPFYVSTYLSIRGRSLEAPLEDIQEGSLFSYSDGLAVSRHSTSTVLGKKLLLARDNHTYSEYSFLAL